MLCSVITKNSNWEIFSKDLVTFKRWKTYILGFHGKSKFEGGGGGESQKTNI